VTGKDGLNKKWSGSCPDTGKRMWITKQAAKQAARVYGAGLHAYRCLDCGLWHTGHKGTWSREQHRQWNEDRLNRGEQA
jgi:hypothetical protein